MGLLEFLFGKPRSKENYQQNLPAPLVKSGKALTRQASVLDLQVGGVVSYDGTDFIVRNRHAYESHGFEWFSFHLIDTISGRKLWLDAEDDDELEMGISQEIDLELSGSIPSRLSWQGQTYRLDEHGFAKVLMESEDSTPKYAQVEYWDFYSSDEESALGVEKWGGDLEVSLSQAIEPYEITILALGPADA
ncbi:hypothetical protein COW36_11135 [bacterium (Candidatus Blackallbacteria) CG17_big_fil_post_rev_8_21_14_2_50_48_46]|uniref:DUF4178 domain-containing protein n=1 Tax=bacterium (Candidatus Blackallbacteria) CG17_big_fil_post_rev_8_21_14_2_50_48_46 TaxID=2014261 RepID=A0A2M7G4I1_9BACT|nr:MAG: hypothetical protein COW64_18230 [bacterium (Candidatus Blackallbacteria) CG18_big_fil_WC_8_21_14_2_50_49_26]PIW16828.1 MAG: hypothetical protein COW36_11135 [bacterium (Candidatus Blackallbacteria) CG17_big_fil_post_rev_8_21_14_2_50_48_46]PIW48025.1 MAG: hypothetical protein COW20_10850 [bacterium (Candidatus Blackallbacteria) CG13_big_fil_rev_8_21_14_2_50_49_14]